MSSLLVLSAVLVLVCKAQAACVEGDLRLTEPVEANMADGTVMEVTFVEYCFTTGSWRVICNHPATWTQSAAVVVCRQLGYSDKGIDVRYGLGCLRNETLLSVELEAPGCIGTEYRISNCGRILGLQQCSCGSHAWVACEPVCINGDIRVVNGLTNREGRVEVCVDGCWGTICNSQEGAVCTEEGFPEEGAQVTTTNGSGVFTSPINCTVTNGRELKCFRNADASCDNMDLNMCPPNTTTSKEGDKESTSPAITDGCPTSIEMNSTVALGAVIGILVTLQVITLLGWIATCFRKRLITLIRQRETDVKTGRNDSYHLQQPHTSEANNEATPTQANYSTSGPKYATVADRIDCYDVIGLNQQAPPTVQPEQAPVEASKKDDDFYNAEEHTYAMIDKKKSKKKAPKDKEEVGNIEEGAK